MRVTQEADYAVRICIVLDEAGEKLGAAAIAERAGITQRFALKILHKLCGENIVTSFKGSAGGYVLKIDPTELSVARIVSAIDGPVCISKCMESGYECSRNPEKTKCKMHLAFCALNSQLLERLSRIKVRHITDRQVTASDLMELIK